MAEVLNVNPSYLSKTLIEKCVRAVELSTVPNTNLFKLKNNLLFNNLFSVM